MISKHLLTHLIHLANSTPGWLVSTAGVLEPRFRDRKTTAMSTIAANDKAAPPQAATTAATGNESSFAFGGGLGGGGDGLRSGGGGLGDGVGGLGDGGGGLGGGGLGGGGGGLGGGGAVVTVGTDSTVTPSAVEASAVVASAVATVAWTAAESVVIMMKSRMTEPEVTVTVTALHSTPAMVAMAHSTAAFLVAS